MPVQNRSLLNTYPVLSLSVRLQRLRAHRGLSLKKVSVWLGIPVDTADRADQSELLDLTLRLAGARGIEREQLEKVSANDNGLVIRWCLNIILVCLGLVVRL